MVYAKICTDVSSVKMSVLLIHLWGQLIMKEIKEVSRVIVSMHRGDIHICSYKGTVKGFTEGGLVKIDPEWYQGIKCVSAANVKVITDK